MQKNCCCLSCDDSGNDDVFPLYSYVSKQRDIQNVEKSLFTVMQDFKPSMVGYLDLSVGDKIRLLEDIVPGQNWHQAENLTTMDKGSVPLNYLGRNLENITDLEAETLLLFDGNDAGCFLVRPNNNPTTPYALSLRSKEAKGTPAIKHYKINFVNGSYYISESIKTANLQNLIKTYLLSNSLNLGLCEKITHPCAKVNPELYDLGQEFIAKEEIDHLEITLDRNPFSVGHYSYVHRGKWHDLIVAVKVPKAHKITLEQFVTEVKMMKMLRHKNIITLYGIAKSQRLGSMVLEYMDQGLLYNYLRGNRLSHYQRIYVVSQIASAMAYLESKNVVHLDLAARNILLNENLHVKLCNFGLSRFISRGKRDYMRSLPKTLSVRWTAPEVLKHHEYSSKSDVWSFAILLMEIYTNGQIPYAEIPYLDKDKLIKLVANGYFMKAPKALPENIYNLMKICWNYEPDKRPTFCVIDTFFSNYKYLENLNFM